MKRFQYTVITIFLFLVQLSWISCEKLIEVKAPNNELGNKQVFESAQTVNSAMAGLYAGLQDNSPIAADKLGSLMGSYTDDLDFHALLATNGNLEIHRNQQIDNNMAISSYWSKAYQLVYVCNAIIEGLEISNALPKAEKNQFKGEALLVRSILYYYLQQIFGDIPYITTTDYLLNQSHSKFSAPEILGKLEIDLKESIELVSDEYRNNERIFPNRKVAELMLAKIYLLQQKWDDAVAIFNGILQTPKYQFEPDISKVFNKNGKHVLWQLKPKIAGEGTKEALLYYFATNSAPYGYALSTDLVNSFDPSDLRKQHWMLPITFAQNIYYKADKYKNLSNNNTEYSIVFRLEEVYLLLAEALTQQDKIAEALPYVNATRQRAGLSLLNQPISKDKLLDEILFENRREFFAEMGHRFFDLKRQGKLNLLLGVKPNWKEFHNLWPIPQSELMLNSNLNPQNPGY